MINVFVSGQAIHKETVLWFFSHNPLTDLPRCVRQKSSHPEAGRYPPRCSDVTLLSSPIHRFTASGLRPSLYRQRVSHEINDIRPDLALLTRMAPRIRCTAEMPIVQVLLFRSLFHLRMNDGRCFHSGTASSTPLRSPYQLFIPSI